MGIQFIPTTLNQHKNTSKIDFLLVNSTPRNISIILKKSCYDCHSNNTNYPWYNKIQPVAWFLENHIQEGKKELNFSEWVEYSNRRKKSKLKSIISQITNNEMPLYSYTFFHKEANISQFEKSLVINYIRSLKDSLK